MRTFFTLFIVAAFSIINVKAIAQINGKTVTVTGTGIIKQFDNRLMFIIEDESSGLLYTVKKPNGAFFVLKPGDVISYKIIILPNGVDIFLVDFKKN